MENLIEEDNCSKIFSRLPKNQKLILLERFSLSCMLLPYYGYIPHCKYLMKNLSSKSRELWSSNSTAFEKLANQQEITVYDCEDKPFTFELYNILYCTNQMESVDSDSFAYSTRVIDSYYLQIKIQTKIECELLTSLIRETENINHTMLFDSVIIENIETYIPEYNQLYLLLKQINVEESKITATFCENTQEIDEVVEYVSSCTNPNLLSKVKICRTIPLNDNIVQNHNVVCHRILVKLPEDEEINAEFIKDYIPLKTKPEQEDGEKFNDTIQEIAISFNNEQELLVPKIKIDELKNLLPNLKKLDITEEYFINESFASLMKFDCGLEIDYCTDLNSECIYIFTKNSILVFKDPIDGSMNVIAFDQLNIRCNYCACPCDLYLKK